MRISYDPDADAMYVALPWNESAGVGPTDIDDFGVAIDTDGSGNPRGYEFLDVRSVGIPYSALPEHVSSNIRKFIETGNLDSDKPVETEY